MRGRQLVFHLFITKERCLSFRHSSSLVGYVHCSLCVVRLLRVKYLEAISLHLRPIPSLNVPRAAVRGRPLKHLEVPVVRRNSTCTRPTGSRSRAPTAAPRDARRMPPPSTSCSSTGSRSRATTEAPGSLHLSPPPRTSPRPTANRLRATPSTLRAVRSSPLPRRAILDTAGDLAVECAAPRLNIRAPRHDMDHKAPQTEAPSPPPCRASPGSPLAAVRDLRGRQNTQTSGCAGSRRGWEGLSRDRLLRGCRGGGIGGIMRVGGHRD